jgi:tetratricopeptide (TPR) repeat protein
MSKWNKATKNLEISRDKFTNLKDYKRLIMVLNTLGYVLERKKDWKAAKDVFLECFNLAHQEKDDLTEAVICTSLGRLLSKPRKEKDFARVKMYFDRSLEILQRVDDADCKKNLAKAHAEWGLALINEGELEEAIPELIKGFELDEQLVNISGLVKITRNLTDTLIKVGRNQDALAYCKRAVIATDNHPDLIRLQNTLIR